MARQQLGISEEDKARHPRLRRQTAKYGQKKRIVRDVWLVTGLVMINLPATVILALALGVTFLSFAILDETR